MELGRLFALIPDRSEALNAAKQVFRVIDRNSKIDSLSEDGLKPTQVKGNIRFENVHFSYPARPRERVLRGLNLKIGEGETNALIGSSGSFGKINE